MAETSKISRPVSTLKSRMWLELTSWSLDRSALLPSHSTHDYDRNLPEVHRVLVRVDAVFDDFDLVEGGGFGHRENENEGLALPYQIVDSAVEVVDALDVEQRHAESFAVVLILDLLYLLQSRHVFAHEVLFQNLANQRGLA